MRERRERGGGEEGERREGERRERGGGEEGERRER